MNNLSTSKELFSLFNITATRIANWSENPSKPRYRVFVDRNTSDNNARLSDDFDTANECEIFALQAAATLRRDQ